MPRAVTVNIASAAMRIMVFFIVVPFCR